MKKTTKFSWRALKNRINEDMFSWLERLNIITMSMCQCQWVPWEADTEMKLGVQGVYLGVTHWEIKARLGRRASNLSYMSDSLSQPRDEFQSKNCPFKDSGTEKRWPVPWYLLCTQSLVGAFLEKAWPWFGSWGEPERCYHWGSA